MLPKESPWDALLKGAQVGNMIAQNRFRNQAAYQAIQQNQVENDLRERQFLAQSEVQNLHNEAARRKLDEDSHDTPLMANALAQMGNISDLDTLKTMAVPLFKSSDNVLRFNQALSSRIMRLSGTTSQRQLADDIAYNTKFDDALDPDLRQISKQGLNDKGTVNGVEGAQLRQYAADEQQRRNLEKLKSETSIRQEAIGERQQQLESLKSFLRDTAIDLKKQGVTENDYVNRHLNQMIRQGYTVEGGDALLRQTFRTAGQGVEVPTEPTPVISPTANLTYITKEMERIQSEINQLSPANTPDDKQRVIDLRGEYNAFKKEADELRHPKKASIGVPKSVGPFPQAPPDRSERKPNTVYMTPKGAYKWTGEGWEAP